MLKVVENEPAVRKYQRRFVGALKAATAETIPVRLGHPGASEKATVSWSERLGIWFFSRKVAGTRYWNAFGVGRPESGTAIAITCEINFPLFGIDRRTGGAFAQNRAGQTFVVHRGKLGGGRRGIGKSLFEESYRGVWELMDDGGEATPVAVIGAIDSPRLARQTAQFIRKIAQIKEKAATRSSQTELTLGELCLREELIGERHCEPQRDTGTECDRGLIVRDLAEALKKCGLRTGNDDHRELLVMGRENRILAIFQILTETTPAGLNAGAIQLLLNGSTTSDKPRLLLALPGTPDDDLREKLGRLGIGLLIYAWRGNSAIFPDLDGLLPSILH
jgi:hypothetical protein